MSNATSSRAALRSVGVAFPEERRTNDWWDRHHPELVSRQREATLARLWAPADESTLSAWDRAMLPHASDPFRGTVARRVLAPHEGSLDLAERACRSSMDAGSFAPSDIDYALVAALRPDHNVVGEATQLARRLGLRCPAIFFETACNAPLVGLQLASDLVACGRYRRILVSVACTYTKDADPSDSFSWFLGDGAGAFVVERARGDEGFLGQGTVPTQETCDVFRYTPQGEGFLLHNTDRRAGRIIRDRAEGWLRQTVGSALDEAGVSLDEVRCLVVNTPVAWYADFVALALGIDRERVIDSHQDYANCGPALLPVNLHLAARSGRVKPGDLVLAHSVGSESTAGALLLRWGEVHAGGQA